MGWFRAKVRGEIYSNRLYSIKTITLMECPHLDSKVNVCVPLKTMKQQLR